MLAVSVAALAVPLAAEAQPAAGSSPVGAERPPLGPSVALSGRFGARALLVIDGQPHTLAAGQSAQGVRFSGWRGESAEVVVEGRSRLLALGGAPVDLTRGGAASGAPGADSSRAPVLLEADPQGHFTAAGSINGRATRFMIDTGASVVTLSQAEADRLGLAFRNAPRDIARTANGDVPVHRIQLDTLRLGTIELTRVAAMVVPAGLPQVLIGNNVLEQLAMQREGSRMTLQRRP